VVAADRVAATVLQGVHGRRRAGQGDSFWQFRPFLQGDSASRIDWRQSAKSDRLFIRETEWEAAQTVALWSDASRSMEWTSSPGHPSKRDRADLLLAALASLVLRGGERVRLIGGGGRSHAGRAGLTSLVETVTAVSKSGSLPPDDPSLPRHARAVLIGDFLAPLEEIHQSVAALAGRPLHGHILQVLDPEEETLGEGNRAYAGRVLFEWAGDAGVLVPRVEAVRGLYAERLRQHRAGVAAIAAAAGWGFLTHRTDQPAAQALLALWQALAPD
jgi:uncharacterized protein (DUF58 family)